MIKADEALQVALKVQKERTEKVEASVAAAGEIEVLISTAVAELSNKVTVPKAKAEALKSCKGLLEKHGYMVNGSTVSWEFPKASRLKQSIMADALQSYTKVFTALIDNDKALIDKTLKSVEGGIRDAAGKGETTYDAWREFEHLSEPATIEVKRVLKEAGYRPNGHRVFWKREK